MTLRVTIEIVPHGEESRKYKIGTLEIANKGTISRTERMGTKCRYGGEYRTDGETVFQLEDVEHYREDGAIALIHTMIEENWEKFTGGEVSPRYRVQRTEAG